MGRGIFIGRSRTPQATDISNPVLKYSDALPRTDLQGIENAVDSSVSVNKTVARWDFPRPKTSDGRKRSKKGQTQNHGFDFQISVPPAEAIPPSTSPNDELSEGMIGIALGSPRMVESQNMLSQMQENLPDTTTESPKISPLRRKPSKWRKIGGLFRAKNALAAGANRPFYQVRDGDEWPTQSSSHSIDYPHQPKAQIQPSAPSKPEVWPLLEPGIQPKVYDHHRKASTPQIPMHTSERILESKIGLSGPLLQVDIPDVQLERYSVMFGGLLSKGQPSPLNRRSKTLDDVSVPNSEIPTAAEFPPPRRRATSPTRSRNPSFTLFPTTAQRSKSSKVLGSQLMPRGPSSLHKSQTSPPGPYQDNSSEPSQVVPMMQSSPLNSQKAHGPQNSVSSFLSAGSDDSNDEKLILQKIKATKSHVDTTKEPEWQIVNRISESNDDTKRKLSPPPLAVNTEDLPSEPAGNASTSSSPTLTSLNTVRENSDRIISPARNRPALSPAESMRMPLSDGNEDMDLEEPIEIPKVVVSIARSISVSRAKRQVLVPIGPRADRLNPDERLRNQKGKTPQVTDAHYGHRHGNSQELRIETI